MPYYDDLNVDLQRRRNQLTQVSDPFSRNYNDKLNRMLNYPYQPEQVPMAGRTGLTNQQVGTLPGGFNITNTPSYQTYDPDYSFLTNTLPSTGARLPRPTVGAGWETTTDFNRQNPWMGGAGGGGIGQEPQWD